jgi:hypothetical protein
MTSALSCQILVSKYYLPLKETRATSPFQYWKWTWYILLYQKVKKCSKNDGDLSNNTRHQREGGPSGLLWDNLNTKMILMDSNQLNSRNPRSPSWYKHINKWSERKDFLVGDRGRQPPWGKCLIPRYLSTGVKADAQRFDEEQDIGISSQHICQNIG